LEHHERQLPFRLSDGLYFEDEPLLIPWGTPLNPATLPGAPDVVSDDDVRLLMWRDRLAFGGLRGDVSAMWIRRRLAVTPFPANTSGLHWACLDVATRGWAADELPRTIEQACEDSRTALSAIYAHLAMALGPAAWSYPGACLNLPSIHWDAVTCGETAFRVSCSVERYGELVAIVVEHWSNDFPEVRAEAERAHAQWARTDTRVPFVAWNMDDERIPARLKAWRRACFARDLEALEARLQQF
jgi:hypothetical protein